METTQLTVPFEITAWDEEPYAGAPGGPALARVTVRKAFSGALEGTSEAQLLTAQGPGGAGYVASEVFVGSLDGRSGSFVVQHHGVDDQRAPRSAGTIVPGSGTGEL